MSDISPTRLQGVMQYESIGKLSIDSDADTSTKDSFVSHMKSAVDAVNDFSMQSGQLKEAFEKGEPGVSLAQTMIASQKANVTFQAMLTVRNKVVQAYKDVMSMPI